MSYRLGGSGGVLERLPEYCWKTDASILSMFRPMVFIRCPKPIMFSSMTSKRELILASIRFKRPSKDAYIAAMAVQPLAGLDAAHAPSLLLATTLSSFLFPKLQPVSLYFSSSSSSSSQPSFLSLGCSSSLQQSLVQAPS
ncbi:hypothetical protein ACOSQ4_032521 [Xanthoceras sorbifolium]